MSVTHDVNFSKCTTYLGSLCAVCVLIYGWLFSDAADDDVDNNNNNNNSYIFV